MTQIKKGTKLRVYHTKYGTFDGIASSDFDTDADEWCAVHLDQEEAVFTLTSCFKKGDPVPTRTSTRLDILSPVGELIV